MRRISDVAICFMLLAAALACTALAQGSDRPGIEPFQWSLPPFSLMSAATTFAPCWANNSAIAAPIPDAVPVMSAILPLSSSIEYSGYRDWADRRTRAAPDLERDRNEEKFVDAGRRQRLQVQRLENVDPALDQQVNVDGHRR